MDRKVKDDGVQCEVFSKKEPGVAVLKMSLASPNFYPGYFVLQWLVQGTATIGQKGRVEESSTEEM